MLVHSLLLAYLFGTSSELEAYFASMVLYNAILALSQTGQIAEVFVPTLLSIKHQRGKAKSDQFFSYLINLITCIFGLVIVIIFVFSNKIYTLITPGFDEAQQEFGLLLFKDLLPLLIIRVFILFLKAYSYAESKFGNTEFFDFISKLTLVITTILFATSAGVYALIIAIWLSTTIELLGVIWVVKKLNFKYSFKMKSEVTVANIFRNITSTLSYVLTTQLYVMAFNAALTLLPQGTYAIVRYVIQIYNRANAYFQKPISTVFHTHLSNVKTRDVNVSTDSLKVIVDSTLSKVLLLACILSTSIYISGEYFFNAIFDPGKVSPSEISLGASIFSFIFFMTYSSGLSQIARKTALVLTEPTKFFFMASIVQIISGLFAFPMIRTFSVTGAILVLFANSILLSAIPIILVKLRANINVIYSKREVVKWMLISFTAVLVNSYLDKIIGPQISEVNRTLSFIIGIVLLTYSMLICLILGKIMKISIAETTIDFVLSFFKLSR